MPFEIVKRTEEPVYDVRHAIEWPDGERKLLSVNASPLFDEDGGFDGMVAVIEAITEQFKNQRKLEESKKRYKQLFTETNEGGALHELIYDDEGNPIDYTILEVNSNFESIIGLTEGEVKGKKATEVYDREKPPYLDRYAEVAINGEPTSFETYYEPLGKHFKISVFSPEKDKFATVFTDITERKEAKENLKESEQRYRRLFETAQDGMLILNADTGKIIDANPFIRNLLGFSKHELVGKQLWQIGKFQDIVENRDKFKKLVEEGYIRYEHLPLKTKSGEEASVEFVSNTYEVNSQKIVQCNIRDVTERKEANEKLEKAVKQFRQAFQFAPYPMMIHAEDSQVIAINDAWLDITGCEGEDISTISDWTEKAYEEAKNNVTEHIEKLYELEERFDEGEYEIRTKEGETRVWDFSSAPLGKAIGDERRLVLSMAVDVTARKKVMSELKEKEKEMSVLFNNLPGMAYRCENNREWTMKFVSQGARELTGYHPEDLIDNALVSYGELIVPEDRDKVWNEVQQALDSDQPFQFEYRIETKEGQEKYVWERGRGVYTDKGELKNLQGFISDITERKNAQKELRQSFIELAETTSRVLGVRDPYTEQHEQRVAELAREVGKRMGLGDDKLLGLYIGGVLHDIGKIVVPETILTKPGELKDVEWQMIRSHPEVGYNQILEDTDFPWPVAEMTLHHHERLDGSGYPDGLEENELTTEVRILGAVDVLEAMSTRRPYRAARTKEETLEEIKKGKEDKYDPKVVDILTQMIEEGEIQFGGK
ncbi:PAS domain S-box protein [Candidatus Bipolaricaulota bacterium]|nr:PAS domain S-box protein [Candidatus Bipolaricaulota bacterium]